MSNNYKYKNKCFIYIFIIFFCMSTYFNVYAGGSPPPNDKCSGEIVANKDGKECEIETRSGNGDDQVDYYDCRYKCDPYSPSLPSWEEIKAQSAVNKQGIASFTLDFDKISDNYYPMDINLFAQYISCDISDGATRYIKSGYVYRYQSITGNYCKKWVIGISKNYMNSTIQSEYKNGNPRENIDIKLFCDKVEKGSRFEHYDPLVGGSNLFFSDHYICRDGIVRDGSGQCKIGTRYELSHGVCDLGLKSFDKHEFRSCLRNCDHVISNYKNLGVDYFIENTRYCSTYKDCYLNCINKSNKSCYKDISTYDTNKIEVRRYNVNICHKPIIKKLRDGMKISSNFYDPNLIHE